MLERIVPAVFVFLWSTGFIGAKYGLPYAEPFTFLAVRMAITFVLLMAMALILKRRWPGWAAAGHSMVTGILIHGGYLGAVFWVIGNGMPAGIAALIVAMQPLLTVLTARLLLGEKATLRQVAAFFVALGGVFMVILPRLEGTAQVTGVTPVNFAMALLAVLAIALGTVYQKRFASGVGVVSGTAAQYFGAFLFLGVLSLAFETGHIEWTLQFTLAMAWLVLVLSLGAVMLLMVLIRRNSSASTASLFYLVPVSTAVLAWLLFGETLTPVQIAGMAIVVIAVARA
ncbi:MAG: DMT family transporter [Phyllobacteriaceae bacterium]|nr:DMT family transporter [Phyllobacteriaceae bacterium]